MHEMSPSLRVISVCQLEGGTNATCEQDALCLRYPEWAVSSVVETNHHY